MTRGAVAVGLLGLLAGVGGTGLFADPLLSRPETIDGRILIFPDHRTSNVFYYVPTGLALARTFDRPQFFFYKYIHVKMDAPGGPRTTSGGVLALTVEFADETEALRKAKGPSAEFRPVPIDALTCVLSYAQLEPEGGGEKREELSRMKLLWTKKSFTLPLGSDSASYLWRIFEDGKATGLAVECTFDFKGYELDEEGKLKESERSARLSFAVPVSMSADPGLFKVINLADKVAFNYRRMSVLCFDFVNGTNGETVKLTVEIEILTAKKQRDFRTVTFTAGSEPQVDLEFNIPEAKGGTYRYRVTRTLSDGRSTKSEWIEGGEMFLDLSTYDIAIKPPGGGGQG